MSDIQRRSSNRPTRRQREQRAYRLVLATGTFGVLAAIGLVLAIAGVLGSGAVVFPAIIAIVCFLLLRRTVSGG